MLIQLFQDSPALFLVVAGVLGLAVGSFVNVVAYRLPIMLQRDWQSQCRELLEIPADDAGATHPAFNLLRPGSHCPYCGHAIGVLENIPVISYLVQHGKCSACAATISPRYPLVEIITGMLSAAVAWHFGFGWQAAGGLLLTWALIALSTIDLDHKLLPDVITLPLVWLGLVFALFDVFVGLRASVIGALAGYLSLWTLYHIFRLATGKEGMGYGDFKLLAALGAWLGWSSLPVIVILSSVVGAAVGITLILVVGRDRNIPIPFGPYLAMAGWITLLWGDMISDVYLRWAGILP